MEYYTFSGTSTEVQARKHPNGGGWVAKTATVSPSAYVGPGVEVFGYAVVCDGAELRDEVMIYDYSYVGPGVKVEGNIVANGGCVATIDPVNVDVEDYEFTLFDNTIQSGDERHQPISDLEVEDDEDVLSESGRADLLKLAIAHRKKATQTNGKRNGAGKKIMTIQKTKAEAADAAWRTAAKKLAHSAAKTLSTSQLKTTLPFDPKTPVGQAAIAYALGTAAAHISFPGMTDAQRDRLALELRVLGMSGLTDMLADTLTSVITPALKSIKLPEA